MSSHKRILKELKDVKDKISQFKVNQEVKVENTLNLEDLRQSETNDLTEIEWAIQAIENKLVDLVLGVSEANRQITDLETGLRLELQTGVCQIRDETANLRLNSAEINHSIETNVLLDDSQFLWIEEVTSALRNLDVGLKELLTGLEEIKQEITEKNSKTNGYCCFTSGPVIRNTRVKNLYVKVLNNSAIVHRVRITVYNIKQNPKENLAEQLLTVLPQCSESATFAIGPTGLDLQEFEVAFEFLNGDTQNVSTLIVGTKGKGLDVVPECTIRHQELLPLIVH